jgi:cytochrome c-type biogenesis protein CcmH
VIGEPRGPALTGAALNAETERVASLLRCPVCQGLSVADSPTALARDMKTQTGALLAAGYTGEQVLAYFEASYGEFVRLEPPRRGVNWLVWTAPLGGLILGAFVVMRALGRLRQPQPPAAGTAGPASAEEAELEPYLRRVRELAYGRREP